MEKDEILKNLGINADEEPKEDGNIPSYSPVDGSFIANAKASTKEDYEAMIKRSVKAFDEWKKLPSTKRGEIVRAVAKKLEEKKEFLGKLVSLEMGKSLAEGIGEVQEAIDIAYFADGLSRNLDGKTLPSERPLHKLSEYYHPLGPVGIVTAFNFPVAVFFWNSAIAWVGGDTTIWKPSSKTLLCGVACQNIVNEVFAEFDVPKGVSELLVADRKIGNLLVEDERVPLISATGSVAMGKKIGAAVGARLGRSILELGGNNAVIVTEHADIELALGGVMFGAIGTAGQRCTSTRRAIVHESVYDKFKEQLVKAYSSVKIGDPLDSKNHMGPLIDKWAVETYLKALEEIKKQGGNIIVEGGALETEDYMKNSGCYVLPVIAEAKPDMAIVGEETFAPILYLIKYNGDVSNAIAINNGVKQGLSSSIYTKDYQQAAEFTSLLGSKCGLCNINCGTSGAEIGGAFGGNWDTGWGRESGSDSWKQYMLRKTCTEYFGKNLPALAQGIEFKL